MVSTVQDILIFDRAHLRRNRSRSAINIADHRFLLDWTTERLEERLSDIRREFPLALDIGTRGRAPVSDKIKNLIRMDCASAPDVIADEDFLPLKPGSIDLVTSTLNLHSVNDLPGALLQIIQALKADGLFLAAMLGGETLFELRESLMQAELSLKNGVSPRVFPFADKQQAGALLQRAGFALPVVDSEIITVTYENMFGLLRDLRGMGEGNIIAARSRVNPGRELFAKAAEHYAQNHSDADGRIRATFEIIFMVGWAPHESQQKPLRPGSAKTRLADALNTLEISTGEKAAP